MPRPLYTSQAAQNCGAYSYYARKIFLTEICWSRQYLSIDPKKSLPRPP